MRDRPTLDLFLISWLILFLELTCIRWFPAHVMYLSFFTNIVLLAAFVGMSIGCLTARSQKHYILWTPFWLLAAVGLGLLVYTYRRTLIAHVAVGDQTNPDEVFFGAEATFLRDVRLRIPVELVAGVFFLLIATLHIGPGQELGRAFNRVPSRMTAYALNLSGSLLGIVMFSLCSYFQLSPVYWFAAVAIGLSHFLLTERPTQSEHGSADSSATLPVTPRRHALTIVVLLLGVIGTVPTSGVLGAVRGKTTTWSPYYRVDYSAADRELVTNLVSHQVIEPRDQPAKVPYALPYLFQRDVPALNDKGQPEFDPDGKPARGPDGEPLRAWKPFKRVLIIGAGSGNDVSRAVQWCRGDDVWIDAVEIDPVIQRIGFEHHPDHPYQDPRVHVTLNDGRNFLRSAPSGTYDLVVFALIDSLVLHSGYANLRLESYLFTQDGAFEDVKRVLKPTGVCVVYNFFRMGWLAVRINKQLREVFGAEPVVFVTPDLHTSDPRHGSNARQPLERIEAEQFDTALTTFFAGSQSVLEPLRRAFQHSGNTYWFPWYARITPESLGRFGGQAPPRELLEPAPVVQDRSGNPIPPLTRLRKGDEAPPEPHWLRLPVAVIEDDPTLRVATDDWPFLYVRSPTLPIVTLRGMVMVGVLSALLWVAYRTPRQTISPSRRPEWGLMGRSFFLGAGFMLVETKAVVHMALLFGGTWQVNSVVFAAILLMSLVGTLYVACVRPDRLQPYYVGLFAALGLGLGIPLHAFLGMERAVQLLLASALVFCPIAFAGVIFATTFGRSSQPDRVMGANVAGAILGGLAENASVILGFRYLLCVAVGLYLASALCGNRSMPAGAAEKSV